MKEITLAEYRQQIESAIERGRYGEAVAHGRRILGEYPRHIGAYWLVGRAMLEAGQDEHAVDVLRRVLSADPEHLLGWVGMSEVARLRGELKAAVWYLERAFELATENETVAEELRRLYGELEGSEPERLQLTQGALARLYLRGELLSRAISELRKLLEEHPDRLDLKVALAEALWREGQRLQASQVCQEILDGQPYNLKANLILGEIWTRSGIDEGRLYLENARAVDPENRMAQQLFGSTSPLPPESPRIAPLDYAAAPEDEGPAWMAELDALPAPEEFALVETGEAMEARIELPAWLQEMAFEAVPEAPPAVAPSEEEAAAPPEEALEEPTAAEPTAMEEMPEEEVLAWLSELDEEEVRSVPEQEEEIPAWLEELDLGPSASEALFEPEQAPLGQEPEPVDIPDWLLSLTPPEAEPPEAAATPWEEPPPAEEPEELTEQPTRGERDDAPSEDEALAWLQQLAEGEEEDVSAEARGPEAEELMSLEEPAALEEPELAGELPAWLESADVPSADEALGWLEQLVEGEEVERPAEAELEAEAPVTAAPAEVPEALAREEAPPLEEPVEVEAPAPAAEVPQEIAPAEAPEPLEEEVPHVEEPVPAPEPALEEVGEALEPEEAPLAEAIEEAPVEDLEGFIAARRAYAEDHPEDHEAWLDLGRVLWQAEERAEAIETYDRLIASGKLLDQVIPDLEDYAQQRPGVDVQRTLGDAYMKADRLTDALDTYRRALAGV